MNKYKLIKSNIKGLFRVKALKDFSDVKKGELGGYVQGEHNLSQEGDCWIYNTVWVTGEHKVEGNIKVYSPIWGNISTSPIDYWRIEPKKSAI